MNDTAAAILARTVRAESGRILSGLIGRLGGDFARAEEALQDACAAALSAWERDGVPERPGAWLTRTAHHKASDAARQRRRHEDALHTLQRLDALDEDAHGAARRLARQEDVMESAVEDDLLRLVFTCCHPALALDARVALTLRTVSGMTTGEIARAFLLPEATLAQRLVRAQQRIRGAGIPFRVPAERELPERLDGVLSVVYLIFNEGYHASAGALLVRDELCEEGARLARLMADLMPEHGECHGLLALMELQHARRLARVATDGRLVPLEEQDRSLWDTVGIARGLRALARARAAGDVGPFTLQAVIAAEHAIAERPEDTDWTAIVAHYDALLVLLPGPVVALNRAAAVAMASGAAHGLRELDRVEADARGALDDYRWLHLLRGELALRIGDRGQARAAFARALALAVSDPERRHIEDRLRGLGDR